MQREILSAAIWLHSADNVLLLQRQKSTISLYRAYSLIAYISSDDYTFHALSWFHFVWLHGTLWAWLYMNSVFVCHQIEISFASWIDIPTRTSTTKRHSILETDLPVNDFQFVCIMIFFFNFLVCQHGKDFLTSSRTASSSFMVSMLIKLLSTSSGETSKGEENRYEQCLNNKLTSCNMVQVNPNSIKQRLSNN